MVPPEKKIIESVPEVGPIPVVLGITGHRDLYPEDSTELSNSVTNILYPNFNWLRKTPVILLSGLAEGADRFVLGTEFARVWGTNLVAALPRPVDSYVQDFPESESRAEFHRLLDTAQAVLIAQPDPAVKGYVEQAKLLVRASHVVLAIWDGKEGEGAGGTAQVVDFCLNGIPPSDDGRNQLDQPETRHVWWLKTRRLRHPQPTANIESQRLFPGSPSDTAKARQVYDRIISDTGKFNSDVVKHRIALKSAHAQSMDYLLPADVRSGLPEPIRAMIDCYGHADVLSIHFQRLLRRCMDVMLICVFLAGILSQVRTWPEIRSLNPHILSAIHWSPLLFFLAAAGAYLWERWNKYHTRYLDYRALAEGLRVQIFWTLAGIKTCVADEYLTRYRGEIEWIRRAIRTTLLMNDCGSSESTAAESKSTVTKHWVEDQLKFFTRNAKKQARMPKVVGKAWKVALGVGFIIAVMKMLPPVEGYSPNRLLVVAGLAVFGLGLLKLRVKILALSEQARQYRRMADVFSRAVERLNAGADQQLILTELGREALAENADWLLLHRERPLELPKA